MGVDGTDIVEVAMTDKWNAMYVEHGATFNACIFNVSGYHHEDMLVKPRNSAM